MRACLVGRWLFLAALCLIPSLVAPRCAHGSDPPVVSRLEMLSTPTLAGGGQMIWVAIPNVSVPRSILTFALESPEQAAPQRTSQTLALVSGRMAEVVYPFAAPLPGRYRVSATLKIPQADAELTDQTALTLQVDAAGPARLEALEPPLITLLQVDSPAPAEAVLTGGTSSWYSFTLPQHMIVTLNFTLKTLSGVHAALYGPNSQTALVAEEMGLAPAGLTFNRFLNGGTYYLKVQAGRAGEAGSIFTRAWTPSLAPPRLSEFLINDGADLTFQTRVALRYRTTGEACEYLASESPGFEGATWKPLTGSPIAFDLTPGEGPCRVYLMVRNAAQVVSPIRSDIIQLQPLTPLLSGSNLVSGNIEVPGDADWYSIQITQATNCDIQTCLNSLRDNYMRLYGPDVIDAAHLVAQDDNSGGGGNARITAALLKPGRYYVKVQGRETAETGTYQIWLTGNVVPMIINLAANGGNPLAYSRQVTIQAHVIGAATQYRASENISFSGASWQPFTPAAAIPFTLSPGDGSKRIFFQVRDAAGHLSNYQQQYIPIQLLTPSPCSLDRTAHGEITIDTQENIFLFTASKAGDYLVEITPDNPDHETWLRGFTVEQSVSGDIFQFAHKVTFTNKKNATYGLHVAATGRQAIRISRNHYAPYDESDNQGKYSIKITPYASAPPKVTNYQIGIGYDGESEFSTTRTVYLLFNTLGGTPTEAKISTRSDFAGATWQPYRGVTVLPNYYHQCQRYSLPAGDGEKTIYFKVRNAAGQQSEAVHSQIRLIEPRPLTVDAAALKVRMHSTYPNIFKFAVPARGDYTITSAPAASDAIAKIDRFEISSDNQNDPVIAWPAETGPFPIWRYTLPKGNYTLLVHPPVGGHSGDYMLRVSKSTPGS